jgi:hypothetical protein
MGKELMEEGAEATERNPMKGGDAMLDVSPLSTCSCIPSDLYFKPKH